HQGEHQQLQYWFFRFLLLLAAWPRREQVISANALPRTSSGRARPKLRVIINWHWANVKTSPTRWRGKPARTRQQPISRTLCKLAGNNLTHGRQRAQNSARIPTTLSSIPQIS